MLIPSFGGPHWIEADMCKPEAFNYQYAYHWYLQDLYSAPPQWQAETLAWWNEYVLYSLFSGFEFLHLYLFNLVNASQMLHSRHLRQCQATSLHSWYKMARACISMFFYFYVCLMS